MMRSENDGVFVVFEGIDGAGSTTQAEAFAARMRAAKRLVHVTREPSNGPIGAVIRLVLTHRLTLPSTNQAEVMALLFAADRLDHVEADIAPHLRDGYVVISDRYDLSSVAYQSITSNESAVEIDVGMARDSHLPPSLRSSTPPSDSEPATSLVAWIRSLNRFARRPDATVVVHVSPEVAAARRRKRGGARELFDDADLQVKLAAAYKRASELMPSERILHVDGDGSEEDVAEAVAKALEPIVGRAR